MLKKPSSPLYTVKDLEFSYSLGKQKVLALSQLSLEIPSSSLIAFSGPSGSGKSTLLHILGLIEPFQKGEVFFLGESIKKMSRRKKNEMRRKKIGFIFQQFHLSPVLTAGENIAYFLARQKLPRKEIRERTDKALDMVGILNQKNKKMSDLSGGQKQRVAIARALAKNPDVIIGDEPTASLDQTTGKGIMQIFSDLVKEKQVSVILSTHDPMVYSYSDYNFHIQDGLVTELEAHP